MTMLWDHYPEGGSELLLALALADIGGDDGGHIYPSVAFMSAKTRMSERNIHYLLAKMVERKLLVVERKGGVINNKNVTTRYRIDVESLKKLPEVYRVQSLHPPIDDDLERQDGVQPASLPGVQKTAGGGAKQRSKGVQPAAPNTLVNVSKRSGDIYPQENQAPKDCGRCGANLANGKTLRLAKWVCQACETAYQNGEWEKVTT